VHIITIIPAKDSAQFPRSIQHARMSGSLPNYFISMERWKVESLDCPYSSPHIISWKLFPYFFLSQTLWQQNFANKEHLKSVKETTKLM